MSDNNNSNIDTSEYLSGNNSSSIEIESNNKNSIIPYNNPIYLYHTNVIEKELDIDIPLLNDFINYDKFIINKNIPKKL
jgi:hypothetical protein